MRRLILYLLLSTLVLFYSLHVFAQAVGIGTTTPNPSSLLDIQGTGKGVLIPRMTQAEVNGIATPPQGLMVFNTSTNSFQFYNGVTWNNITHSGLVSGIANRVPHFIGPWGMSPGMITDNGSGISVNTGGTAPDASAALDVSSTTKGVLVPRMSTAQRTAIVTPATGLLVFDNTTNTFWFHNGTAWAELVGGGGGGSNWTVSGNNIYNSNPGTVGINTTTPNSAYDLDINGNMHVLTDQYINRDVWIDRNLDVDGTSNFLGNIIASGNINIGGNITSVDNITVGQDITVGGRGIVQSNSSAQRVVAFPNGAIQFSNGAPAGYFTDVTFALSNVFAANPIVSLGNITNATGNIEKWTFTIHAVDIVAHTFLVRVYCPNGCTPVQMTLNFIAIGTAL